MKIRNFLAVALLALCSIVPAKAQTNVFIDGQLGGGSFGFRNPHMAIGLGVETGISRFRSDTRFLVSPDVKRFTNFGHSFGFNETVSLNISRVSLRVGTEYNIYWSGVPIGSTCPAGNVGPNGPNGEQCFTIYQHYHKGGWAPYVGVGIRDDIKSLGPGKLTVDYYIKTGYLHLEKIIPTECVFASPGNACPITSPQETGVIAEQTFELWPRASFGLRGGWIQYGDQVNPFAPALGQTRHNTGFTEATFRYRLK